MSPRSYFLATAMLFSIICVIQLLRIVFAWEAVIGGWSVPMWLSWIAVVVTAALAYFGFTHSRGRGGS